MGEKNKKPIDLKVFVSKKRMDTDQSKTYSPLPMLTKIHLPLSRVVRKTYVF